jgi:hypothetical protein
MRLPTLISILAVALPPTGALTSAGCICTLVGYESGFRVDVGVPQMLSTVRIEVAAEDDVLALDYEVANGSWTCPGECQVLGKQIEIASSFSGDGDHASVLVRLRNSDRGPSTASVRVSMGDAILAEQTFKPRYDTDEPNGRGCGKRTFARASLDVTTSLPD